MNYPFDFTVFQIETANEGPSSLCAIGVMDVIGGQPLEPCIWHVMPPTSFYVGNTITHGITAETVADKPNLKLVWEDIRVCLENRLLISFGANHFVNCLVKSFDRYRDDVKENPDFKDARLPSFEFIDSFVLWHELFGSKANKLPELCATEGFTCNRKNLESMLYGNEFLAKSAVSKSGCRDFIHLKHLAQVTLGERYSFKAPTGTTKHIPCLPRANPHFIFAPGDIESSFDATMLTAHEYDFIAVDFETANENLSSACSIGLAFVKGREIEKTEYHLIKPPGNTFDKINVGIHGIKPDDVENEMEFPDVWESIRGYFGKELIVAHNARFDMSVLKCCLEHYGLGCPSFTYADSIPMTRIRDSGAGYSLAARATSFGVDIGLHHNAESDATVCANIVLAAMKNFRFKTFSSYMGGRNIERHQFVDLIPIRVMPSKERKAFNRWSSHAPVASFVPSSEEVDKGHPVYQKTFVFTGELESMERNAAMQRVADLGGIVKANVNAKINYVVVGIQDISVVGESGLSTKQKRAIELAEKGASIKVITEADFISLLGR